MTSALLFRRLSSVPLITNRPSRTPVFPHQYCPLQPLCLNSYARFSTTSSETKRASPKKTSFLSSIRISSSSSYEVLSRLVPFLWSSDRKHRTRVLGAVFALILSKFATIQAPLLLGRLIDALCSNAKQAGSDSAIDKASSVSTEAGTSLLEQASSSALADPALVIALVTGYGIARICSSGFNEFRNAVFSRVSSSACSQVACATIDHLHRLDLDFILQSKSGELTTILSRGIRSVTQLLNIMLFQIIPTVLEFSLVLSLLAWKLGPTVAGITLTTMVAYLIFTTQVTAKRTLYRKAMNVAEQKSAGVMMDSLVNSESVRFFMNEALERQRYEAYQREYERASVKVSQSLAMLNFGQQLIFNVGLWSAMFFTATNIASGVYPVGTMAFLTSLLFQLAIPLNMLGSVYRETRLNLVDFEKLHELLSLQPKCVSPVNAKPFVFREGGLLKLEDVSFEYRQSHDWPKDRDAKLGGQVSELMLGRSPIPIFSKLNMEIQPGWKVGIVGVSGSGKTSLIKLLYRLYDPTAGRITLDGQDLKTLELGSFRQHIGIVPQDVVLFNDTVLFNLRYGRINATFDEIVEATKAARIYETITRNLPQGFDTVVGERGLKLSGGEKQRLAIARCLLRNPRIVVLDEATSALDTATEHDVLESFRVVAQSRTSIVIAHRLSTVVDADRIYVLGKGGVLEYGTHETLLGLPNGHYAAMWAQQRSNFTTVFSC